VSLRDLESAPAEKATEKAPQDATGEPRISIIVVVEEGPEPVERIVEQYADPLRALEKDFEFVFVSRSAEYDRSEVVDEERRTQRVKILQVSHSVNPSMMLKAALQHCSGDIVITMPSSPRVKPGALPRLVRQLEESHVDVAAARRWPRRDSWINRLQTRFCNGLINLLTGSSLRDITCRVYALRREVLMEIPLYGNYFRFLPIIAEREGFKVEEVEVEQHSEGRRTRVYSPRVYLGWFLDIFGIFFLIRFTQSPLRFFGLVGTWTGIAGGAILFVLFVQRLGGKGIADRPMLLLGALLVTLGVQFVALGLIGEIVVHYKVPEMKTYRVARRSWGSTRDTR